METDDLWGYGVDPALGFPALAAVRPGKTPQLIRFESGLGTLPERLEALLADVELKTGQMCSECPPGLVLIERPTGRFHNPHLNYATGVIILGLHRALKDRFAFPVSIVQIAVKDWKKSTVGAGNAAKEQVMAYVLEEYPELAGCSQDEADATCLARMAWDSVEQMETATEEAA